MSHSTSPIDPTAGSEAVDAYMAMLTGDALVTADKVRRLIQRAAPGITETVRYKMPCFLIDGDYLVYLGAWKRHLGLYPIPRLEPELDAEIAPFRAAKDTLRFPYANPTPYDLIERVIDGLISRRR